MQIGFVGLGRMGANMVKRVLERGNGIEVVAYDQNPTAVADVAASGAKGVGSLPALVAALTPPRAIWIMVPAGAPVDQTLTTLADLCAPGDLFVDGGNTYYKDDLRRADALASRGMQLLDAGTSGGIWGREIGYALTIGGTDAGFARIEPVVQALAPEGGFAHVGPTGSGHFAKMVHNGIEYGLMQAYAEGFSILEKAPFSYQLATLAHVWNHGSVIRSWLLELAESALDEDPGLKGIRGYVEDTGEGRWTVAAAIEEAVPAPVITQALYTRFRSREEEDFADKFVAVLRREFGGHAVRPSASSGTAGESGGTGR